jgi:molecular chaperone GrpE
MIVRSKNSDNDETRPTGSDDSLPSEVEDLAGQSETSAQDLASSEEAHEDGKEQDHDDATGDDIETLRAELDRVRAEGQEYLDGWQRARAEFANFKKRVERENQDQYKRVAGDILSRYLGIIDDLELALRERPQDGDAATWADGIAIIHQKLIGVLEAEGVELIEAQGKQFDPNVHEALSHEETSEHEEGEVIEVIRQGYRMGERVLRPALVRVAK